MKTYMTIILCHLAYKIGRVGGMKWNPPFRHSAISFQVFSYVIARSMATKQSHGRVDKKAMRLLLLPGKDRNDTEIRNLS